MNLNKLTTTFAAAVFMSAVSSAQAVSMSITTTTPSVTVGETIELMVLMDFSDDPTLGGGFDINFDPSLVSYVPNSYITDPSLGSDPNMTRDDNPSVLDPALRVDVLPNRLAGAAFGNFGGLSGPALVGPLSFIADAGGVAVFGLGPSTSSSVNGFISASSGEEQFPFPIIGPMVIAVTIGPGAVPLPATLWLFGSGLIGLVGISRRKKVA